MSPSGRANEAGWRNPGKRTEGGGTMHVYRCAECGHRFESEDHASRCPECRCKVLIHEAGERRRGKGCSCGGSCGGCGGCSH